mgnify:CR=1 FL=1
MEKHVQFSAYANLMNTMEIRIADLIGNNLGLVATDWPWQIPEGQVLRITDAHFGSKHIVWPAGPERSSYMHVTVAPPTAPDEAMPVLTVTDLGPNISFQRYAELPSGWYVNIVFASSAQEQQNMNGLVLGYLTEAE